jgi:hypothetical protein
MRLFLNPEMSLYLRGMAREFNVSTSHMRTELQHLSDNNLINCQRAGRQINYRANITHPLFPELQSMVRKALGMDRIVDSIIERLGNLETAFIVDDYAEGRDTGIIDLVLIGEINKRNLADLVTKTETYLQRKIRVLTFTEKEFRLQRKIFNKRNKLILWQARQDSAAE